MCLASNATTSSATPVTIHVTAYVHVLLQQHIISECICNGSVHFLVMAGDSPVGVTPALLSQAEVDSQHTMPRHVTG